MSGKRIVEETVCPSCSRFHTNPLLRPFADPESSGAYCHEGGSRRVLTEGQYVLIERIDYEAAAEQLYDGFIAWLPDDNRWKWSTNETAKQRAREGAKSIVAAALSDHTEATP